MSNSDSLKNDTWSAAQYAKFEKERNRPIKDLLAQLNTESVKNVMDIGCGPGNSTQLLQEHFSKAAIAGMDSSADMIAAAKLRLPDAKFEIADISTWHTDTKYDLIFANAALQWVPDHARVFPMLLNQLNDGGTLAVQMPDNFEEPAHRLMREVAANGPWKDKLAQSATRIARENADWYFERLADKVTAIDIWRTTYYHVLSGGASAIVEWFKGTGLRPFLDPLNAEERSAFLEKYTAEIAKAYKIFANGTVLLPFPRLFIVLKH